MKPEELRKEFNRQMNNLLQKGYPQAAGMLPEEFLKHLEPLKEGIDQLTLPEVDLKKGRLPYLGWCWDGNPHTWLGSASCGRRLSRLSLKRDNSHE